MKKRVDLYGDGGVEVGLVVRSDGDGAREVDGEHADVVALAVHFLLQRRADQLRQQRRCYRPHPLQVRVSAAVATGEKKRNMFRKM